MTEKYSDKAYDDLINKLFSRFQSFQSAGKSAYKPGLERMELLDSLLGHPHKQYRTIHIAGTNGKGSVSNMLASCLSAQGLKVGLYTSPHIEDFRERARIKDGAQPVELVSKEYVWDFLQQWFPTFENLELSFFEITTALAFSWFASKGVDIAVVECGLGGRLDSTNIITPELSVITNIGLDHCDILGHTLPEIAFEKAGIIKPKVPCVVGESSPETDPIFRQKSHYTNMPGSDEGLLIFADAYQPRGWSSHEEILRNMDLQGIYQSHNLRTVLAAAEKLNIEPPLEAIEHTAERMDFHGRWERLRTRPTVIADIGHNEHGLKYNFAQLNSLLDEGKYSSLIMVYGSVGDKDVDAVLRIIPPRAKVIFTAANNHRALPAEQIKLRYEALGLHYGETFVREKVAEACALALSLADEGALVYIGGSTYVVAEAIRQ